MYFRDDWSPLGDRLSYGHDIEGAWLIREAAHVHGNPILDQQTVAASLGLARGVLSRGFLEPGHLGYEGDLQGVHDRSLHWWVHAEAMVGFYDAYQVSGESPFRTTAEQCWATIQRIFIDRNGGEWYKVLNEKGTPSLQSLKIGPWECPYHHARSCFEMMDRLSVSPGSE
jgi:mannobiose 2-epimerase